MGSTFTATDAAGYERMMGRWSRVLAQPFLDFAAIPRGARVLDLGCGTGSLSRALLDRVGGEVVGVDVSEAYVAHARAAVGDARASFRVGDAASLDHGDGEFDAVASILVLNFIPDYPSAVAEMVRVTRSGGVLAAAVWDTYGGLAILRTFWDTAAMLDPAARARRSGVMATPLAAEGTLSGAFRAAGARNVEERDLLIRMNFSGFDDYWGPFLSGQGTPGAYVAALDEPAREAFRAALLDAYCAGGADGPRSFVAVARAVRARAP